MTSDVRLFQTPDDGDISVVSGVVELGGGLETSVYLSLFGGNDNDSGRENDPDNWWGNYGEPDPAKRFRSETQYLLRSIPITSNNIKRIRDGVLRDLQWMVTNNIASSVDAVVTAPALNTVKIVVSINAEGIESQFEYVENWKLQS